MKRVKNMDRIIISHVDVSSCGMSSRRVNMLSIFNLKG